MNTTRTWKRILAVVMAVLLMVSAVPLNPAMTVKTNAAAATTLFLTPNSNWKQASAWFAAYFFVDSTTNTWVKMTDSDNDGIYECDVPSGYPNVIFCRMNSGSSTLDWSNCWNQTSDLTVPTDGKNHYTVASGAWSKGSGSWSTKIFAYYVAGSSSLCGENWSTTTDKMTKNSNGTYSITFTNIAAGTHTFKVVANGDWDAGSWPNADYSLNLSSPSDVTITFNPSTEQITVDTTALSSSYSVTFDLQNISKSAGADSASSSSDYSATLAAASGYSLPDSITVKAGSTTLTSGTHYTYSSSTGAIKINAAAITGNITITATGVATPIDGWDIYLKPGNNWSQDSARFAVYYWTDSISGTWVDMTATSTSGVYTATVPADAKVIFGRFAPDNSTNDFSVLWNRTGDLTVPYDGAMFVVGNDQWGNESSGASGTWEPYSSSGSSSSGDTFYVNTDIVDYLNDYRVNSGEDEGYSSDNQGIWMDSPNNPVFSYINYIISSQEGYSYPLYFGNLLRISNRFGVKYTPFNGYDEYNSYRNNGKVSLNNWNTGANVALNNNNTYNAVVQGLVGDRLDQYGQLVDPKNPETQLFYFDKTSIESWKTSDGTKRLAAYYSNLQFPFNTTYDPSTRVTTYSYDSATDNAVFIDYGQYNSANETNPMYTSTNYAKDQYNNKGFFPLNKPGESENVSNYGFGVKFTIDFTVSDDGTIQAADGSETPVQFTFTGDDDVWVFIDGYLVLDMGGAHTKAKGTIDFKDLKATVQQAAQVSDTYWSPSYYNNTYGYNDDGDQRESLSISNNLDAAFPEELAAKFQSEYTTGISQVHTLTMFYMERGTIESNMSIQFSMSPIPSGLTVSKDIENVNPGLNAAVQDDDEFSFTVQATDSDGKSVTFDGYTLTDHNSISTSMSASKNTITGVRGDRYAHKFTTGQIDAFTAGTTFTITEGDYSSKYSGTRWVVYEYSDGYREVDSGSSRKAVFTMDDDSAGNYALNFVNTLRAGSLTLNKKYSDTLIDTTGMEFVFNINLDLDGKGYKLFPGLTYDVFKGSTLVANDQVSPDGTVKLLAGQTVVIEGIPVNTKYQIVEIDDSALWEVDGEGTVSGTMSESGATFTFTNKTTAHALGEKVIFVEAGTDTNYTIKDGANAINLNSVTSNSSELNVNISGDHVVVNGKNANAKYSFTYAGTYSDGSYVSGKVTVYTYAATHKTYVFDFGLSSNLADTTYGDGLFQGGAFYNTNNSSTTATLLTLTAASSNSQTTVSTTTGKTISSTGTYNAVTFTPVAFMSKVETYTYTVRISVSGKTFDAKNPETGTIVTGSITVMPANSVYYEDNFNVTDKDNNPTQEIIYSSNGPTSNPNLTQSNDQDSHYGYDGAYLGGYTQSSGSATTLSNGQYAYFTFTGTGFDLISRTNGTSAGFAVYVFTGTHSKAKLDYMTKFSGATPADMVFVDTYYHNGDLHQVPVVSVRLGSSNTYTVYIQALATSPSMQSVSIDGIRIYDPLANTDLYPQVPERDTTIEELRVLYGVDGIVSLAGRGSNGVFNGLGKADAVFDAMENASITEDMEGNLINYASDLENIYLHGPNNEMYLPYSFGISFSYKVTDSDWTLQLGAKAVSANKQAKSISVYVRTSGRGSYQEVAKITLSSTTDMYYDLSDYLSSYCKSGTTYDIVIISNSTHATNEFVSLTTVKYSGVTLS